MRRLAERNASVGSASVGQPRHGRVALEMGAEELHALVEAADFGVGELLFRAETMQDSGNTRQAKVDRELARKAHFALARLQEKLARQGA